MTRQISDYFVQASAALGTMGAIRRGPRRRATGDQARRQPAPLEQQRVRRVRRQPDPSERQQVQRVRRPGARAAVGRRLGSGPGAASA